MTHRVIIGATIALAAGAGALTMEEAVERARRSHPDARIHEEAANAARRRAEASGRLSSPEFEATPALVHRTSGDGSAYAPRIALGVSQTFEYPGKRGNRKELAHGELERRLVDLERYRLLLERQVRSAFVEALTANQVALVRSEQRKVADEFAAYAERRAVAGGASELELLQARAELVEATSIERRAVAEVVSTKLRLASLVDEGIDTSFVLEGDLEADTAWSRRRPAPPSNGRGNPALRRLDLGIEQARRLVEAARLETRPDFTVGPSVEFDAEETTYAIGLRAPLPLWNRGASLVAAAEADLRRMEARRESALREMRVSIAQASERLVVARRELALRDTGSLGAVAELRRRTEAAYARGAAPLAFLLEARRGYFDGVAARLEAVSKLALARIELDASLFGEAGQTNIDGEE